MPHQQTICRIGTFYDGSHVTYAQNYLFHERKLGWLNLKSLNSLLQEEVAKAEPSFAQHRTIYSAWHQGLFPQEKATEEQLRRERGLHSDLLEASITPHFVRMSSQSKEKGVDVSLTIDALTAALQGKIDVAVLVAGDADFAPLIRSLNEHSIRVLLAYFKYNSKDRGRTTPSAWLLEAANYSLDIITQTIHHPAGNGSASLFAPTNNRSSVHPN